MFQYTQSQQKALDLCRAGKSFFLTGSAGTGKSRLISEFKSLLVELNKNVAVCATVGLAAVQIGGRTLDSFMKIFPQDASISNDLLVSTKMKSRSLVKSLKELDVILIDEVSMLTPEKFLQCDALLKSARANQHPFGGVQVILIGDFFQLPPISNSNSLTFIFELDLFYALLDEIVELEEVHRQKDSDFVNLLHRMRIGQLTESDITILQSRVNAPLLDDGIKATCLFAQNLDVDRINASEQDKLKTRKNVFVQRSGCKKLTRSQQQFDVQNLQKLQETLLKEVGLPESIELKVGAQVMLIYNLDTEHGLVNGSRGVVIGFAKTSKDDPERDFDPEPLGSVKKDGFDRNLYYPDDPLPIVKFASSSHSNSNSSTTVTTIKKQRAIEIPFVRWEKVEHKFAEAWVTALPLKLAWSSTIHKSQGQSLDRVEATLDKSVFAYGQAFVALSRVTTLEGLTLKSFDPSVVRAHPAVLQFSKLNFGDEKKRRSQSQSQSNDAKAKAKKEAKKRDRSRSEDIPFAPVVLTCEQTMASEARMLEIFAQQRLQDQDEDDIEFL
jgi:ATP-dependent DNA helicase PIF1